MSSHSDLLAAQIQAAISHAIERGDLIVNVPANIPLERPKNRDHGDYASSIALQLAKPAGKNPREVAELLKKDLEKLGVKVMLNTAVQEVKPRQILVKGAATIPSEVTIWAAGVKGEPTGAKLNLPLINTRIDVENTLQVKHYPHIFAIGDIAGFVGENGRMLPMVAPVALQQGRHVAKQIRRIATGQDLKPFKYIDKGSMATIGRHKAIVEVKNITSKARIP